MDMMAAQPIAPESPSLQEVLLPDPQTPDLQALSLEAWAMDMAEEVQAAPIAVEPPIPEDIPQVTEARWYLGLDFGTTGISAVLLNQATYHLYPLYWTSPISGLPERSEVPSELKFRLPSALSLQTANHAAFHLHDFKPYLKLPQQTSDRRPTVVQGSDTQQISLIQITQALSALLSSLIGSAEALELEAALPPITGVAIGYPADWSEVYCSNLRQIVLDAHLVTDPDQIYFVEDSIAAFLSTLNSSSGREIVLPHSSQRNAVATETSESKNTLVLVAGAVTTELAIMQIAGNSPVAPNSLDLNRNKVQIRSLPFAGQGIDQDIICQLIYPFLTQDAGNSIARSLEGLGEAVAEDFIAEAIDLTVLAFHNLKLPHAGEPDLALRSQLQQRLQSSRSGNILLNAAQYIKLTLQQQSRCRLQLGHQQQTILRQDLGSQVLLPYIQRLNRELNALLTQADLTVTDVNQVICTGGTASLGAIARWLRQKLPNATITQDTYRASSDRCIPGCSRIAYGLAVLPLQPQLLQQPQFLEQP